MLLRPEVVLVFDPPAEPLSMNQAASYGQRVSEQAWRDRAFWAWCEAHPGVGPSGRAFGCPADIWTAIPFDAQRRRDPINFAATVKRIVDGLVNAGAWPDDTPEYVTQHIPTLHVVAGGRVVVRVTPRADLFSGAEEAAVAAAMQSQPRPPRESRARSTARAARRRPPSR